VAALRANRRRGGHPDVDAPYPEFSAHLMRITETAHWLEWQDWADSILARPFEVKNGYVHIPDTPGSGIEWNETAMKRFRYDR